MSELNSDKLKYSLTSEDMWGVINKEGNNWGIPGYESPKIYFDHKKNKYDRETLQMHQDVWAKKRHYPKPNLPVDENGKPIIPTKKTFIDEWIKLSNSNFSKQKFDSYVESLQEKGRSLDEVEGIKKAPQELNKDKNKAKIYKYDRNTFIGEIMNNEKKKLAYTPYLEEIVSKVKEKQERYPSPNISDSEKMKLKYKGKSSLPKGDKVTFLADSEYLGERIPFYSSKPEENDGGSDGEEKSKKMKTVQNLSYPDKNVTLKKSPQWKIHKQVAIDKQYFQTRDELHANKVENLRKSWDDRRIKFIDDVSQSYFKIHDSRKGHFKYKKPTEKAEQYILAKEQNPLKYPGPQQYFRTPQEYFTSSPGRKKEAEASNEGGEGSPKVYYMNHDKTDKRLYKPMKSHLF